MRNLTAVLALAILALTACDGSGPATIQAGDAIPADSACISDEPVHARAPSGGTALFSVVPEGLPEGAEIVGIRPCSARQQCQPGEAPLYYVPCAAAGPSVCEPGQQYWPACSDTGRCPDGRSPMFFRSAISVCSQVGMLPLSSWTTVRCADATEVERRSILFITVPGDCDEDGRVTSDEVDTVIRAVFDTQAEQCGSDLNLDGRVTTDELQKVVAFATRRATTGDNCPLPDPTPTPDPGGD